MTAISWQDLFVLVGAVAALLFLLRRRRRRGASDPLLVSTGKPAEGSHCEKCGLRG